MDVKPDYKQTEVGVIPEDWAVKLISDVCWFQEGPGVRNTQFTSTGVKLLNGTNIFRGRINLDTTSRFISDAEAYGAYAHFMVDAGDIVIACSGISVERFHEKVAVVTPVHLPFCMNTSTMRFKPRQEHLVRDYLCHFLMDDSFKRQIAPQATGSAQLNFGPSHVAKVELPLPSISEQRYIASALSDAASLLEALDRLIAKKRDLKHAAMQQLLTGQTRLPGFTGEWMVKRLEEVAPLQRGFDLPNPKLVSGPYPVVYSNGIMNHHADFQVKGPGVVTGRSGTIGRVTFVEKNYWPHNTSLWVTSFKNHDPKFIFYLYTKVGFERFASGSGVPTLNRNDAHAYKVLVPPTKAEQTAIAQILSEMDAELASLEQRRDKARAIKQGMMQELLSGRIRLVNPDGSMKGEQTCSTTA